MESQREVPTVEGMALAQQWGCPFVEAGHQSIVCFYADCCLVIAGKSASNLFFEYLLLHFLRFLQIITLSITKMQLNHEHQGLEMAFTAIFRLLIHYTLKGYLNNCRSLNHLLQIIILSKFKASSMVWLTKKCFTKYSISLSIIE